MRFCAIDVEGDAGEKGILGVAFYCPEIQEYVTDRNRIIAILKALAIKEYLFIAHNAEYDCAVIFWQLGLDCKMIYYNGRFNHAEWRWHPRRKMAHIWDTLALAAHLSLAKLGDSMGIPKYETPQVLEGIDPNRYKWFCESHNRGECLECYAIRDAEICYRYFDSYVSFLSQYGVAPKRTLGSSAVALWRKLDSPNNVGIRSERIDALARASYHGGRTEVFKVGTIPSVYMADVVSMYPYVMKTNPMADMDKITYLEGGGISAKVLKYEGVSEATVYHPDRHVPCLPVVSNDKLYFPIGNFRGTWAHSELRAAVERGVRIREIHTSTYSTRVCFPYLTYIDTLFALRAEFKKRGDARQAVVKIILNALYGRMGLSSEQEERRIQPVTAKDTMASLQGWELIPSDGVLYASKHKRMKKLNDWANVLWASNITAYARVHLLQYLEWQGDNLVYCDTDSVISTAPIQGLGEGLGSLEDQGHFQEALILAPKLYRLIRDSGEKVVRAKGVPRSVAEDYILKGEAEFSAPYKPTESLQQDQTAGVWRVIKKHRHLTPAKRQPVSDHYRDTGEGNSDTIPIVFEDSSPEPPPETP